MREWNSHELELQVVVTFQTGVLGPELRPSSRTVCALTALENLSNIRHSTVLTESAFYDGEHFEKTQ